MKGGHLFWSRHAVRRCVEYTVDFLTHLIQGGTVPDVTLAEKKRQLYTWLGNANLEETFVIHETEVLTISLFQRFDKLGVVQVHRRHESVSQ